MGSHIQKMIARNRSVRKGSFPYEDGDWLRRLYQDERMTLRAIAKAGGCSLRTIARWMDIHRIPTRKGSEGHINDRSGPKSPHWRGGPPPCPVCGGEKDPGAKWCLPCRTKSYAGEGNPNYRGMADIMATLRAWVSDYWRPAVMARDSYTCVVCGDSRGGNLHAHHRIRLSDLVRDIYQRDKPDISSPRARLAFVEALRVDPAITSIDNGVTLCEPCHNDAHRAGGHTDAIPRSHLKQARRESCVNRSVS